jgi:phosphatidylserine decarboxylase
MYSLLDLVNGDREMAERYQDGEFVTIYLSPQDYHRIHMPVGGKLVSASYIPGSLFPVNPFAVRNVSNLFARNERLITYAESQAGLVGIIKVGATIVGSVKVVYGDMTTNVPPRRAKKVPIPQGPRLAKGDELARFEFGSTVILLFEKGRAKLRKFKQDEVVLLGQKIGEVTK